MADRYWVGGTGTWDGSTTTNWSDVSGGVGGFSAPTSADDVYFDSLSNATAYTATISTGAVCRDVNVVGPASGNVTLAGSALNWSIYGSLFYASTQVVSTFTGVANFRATTTGNTITTNGVIVSNSNYVDNIIFNGIGGTWTLGSALSTKASITLVAGSLDTANWNITCTEGGNLNDISNSLYKKLVLGSSIVRMSSVMFTTNTNLTIDFGTSTFLFINHSSRVLNSGGRSVYNVTYNTGNNTLPELAVPSITNTLLINGAGVTIRFHNDCSIYNLITSLNSNSRAELYCSSTRYTITISNSYTLRYTDFYNISMSYAEGNVSGYLLGNLGNVTGVTFPASRTIYWNKPAGGSLFDNNCFALSAGGSVSIDNTPVAGDTLKIVDAGLNSGAAIYGNSDGSGPRYFALDVSSRILPITLLGTISLSGTVILNSTVYFMYSDQLTGNVLHLVGLYGQTTTFNQNGANIGAVTSINNTVFNRYVFSDGYHTFSGTVQLTSSLNCGILLYSGGTFDTNNYAVTTPVFTSSNTNARTLNLGSSTLTLTGSGTAFNAANSTNLTITGTGSINMTSASAKTFAGGGKSYPTLNQGGSGNLTITGANTFDRVSNTVYPATVIFPANTTTTVSNFSLSGSSEGQLTMVSSTANTRFTLSKSSGHIAPYNCTIKDSNVVGGATWRAPANYGNINAGNNLGWTYTDIDTKLNNFFFYFEDPIAV